MKLFLFIILFSFSLYGCKTSKNRLPLTPLESCLEEVKRDHRTCVLGSFGGVSSIGNPIVQKRIQICKDRKYKYEDRCYNRFRK